MNNKTLIIFSLVLIFLGGFIFFYRGNSIEQKTPVINQTETVKFYNWASKTDEQAYVTVVVTPIDILSQSKEWKFNILMDTHSVELDHDLLKSVFLVDNKGKEYKPVVWEGPVGGHHREGVLKFNQITPIPESVELKISGIGDVDRSFVWEL